MKNTFYLNLSTADSLGIALFKYSIFPDERFIITNSALALMLGYNAKSEIKRFTFADLFVSQTEKEEFLGTLKRNGNVHFFETRFRKSDGKPLWVAITASVITSRERDKYVEGIIEDISSHKEMEEKLALEKDMLQNLLDNMPDAIYFKDDTNHIIKFNRFYAKGVNLPPDQIFGKTDFDFFPAAQAEVMFEDDNKVLATGEPIVGKIERTKLPNGTWNQVITTKIPMYDGNGKVTGTMGITRDMTAYANLERERVDMLISALMVLAKVLEMRDPYTFGHARNVAVIAERIAEKLGWDENRLLGMRLAGQLHDLGKISIPLDILNKPGKLSELEYQLIKEHVNKCYDLIKDIKFPFSLAETILQHHERLDGSGYPNNLRNDQILLEARILAVSDVLESMTAYRPYREALGIDRALEELQDGAGKKYDERIVSLVRDLTFSSPNREFWLN